MTKILILFDLILGVICGVRHEYKRTHSGEIQEVKETYVITPHDTLVVDTVYYTPLKK